MLLIADRSPRDEQVHAPQPHNPLVFCFQTIYLNRHGHPKPWFRLGDAILKFKLSTLFLIVLSCALAVAWYSERSRFLKSSSEWQAEKQLLNQKFEEDLAKFARGCHLICRSDVATEYMWLIRGLTDAYNVPYEETNDRVNVFVVRGIVDSWCYREEMRFAKNLFGTQEEDTLLLAAQVWWELGSIKSSSEFFELAKEASQLVNADIDSAEFDSLRELVKNVAETTLPYSR